MKYLGVDYGRARVGVAVSDDGGRLAFPLKVLQHTDPAALASAIALLAKVEEAVEIILGMPRAIQGIDASLREEINSLADLLKEKHGLPSFFQDEILTTRLAEEYSEKNADAAAAALILQSFLDRPK